MPDDPLFCNNEARCTNRPAMDEIIIAAFTSVDRATLIDRLRKAAIAFGEVNDVAGLSNHPALRRIELGSPTGTVSMVAPPARHDGETPALGPIPAVGQHSEIIRKEFAT